MDTTVVTVITFTIIAIVIIAVVYMVLRSKDIIDLDIRNGKIKMMKKPPSDSSKIPPKPRR